MTSDEKRTAILVATIGAVGTLVATAATILHERLPDEEAREPVAPVEAPSRAGEPADSTSSPGPANSGPGREPETRTDRVATEPTRAPAPSTDRPRTTSSEPGLRTVEQGASLWLEAVGATVSVSFSDELGGVATLRIQPLGGTPVVESLLGPGGEIFFRSRTGEHRVAVVDWKPEDRTVDLLIQPGS